MVCAVAVCLIGRNVSRCLSAVAYVLQLVPPGDAVKEARPVLGRKTKSDASDIL